MIDFIYKWLKNAVFRRRFGNEISAVSGAGNALGHTRVTTTFATKRSLYQDRLGTNILGMVEQKTGAFSLSQVGKSCSSTASG
jgi:hypothetical protein